MLTVWSTHFDDLQREAAAAQRLVELGVRSHRRRRRERLRLPALRPRLRAAATEPVSCAHAAAMAEGWVPGLRTSLVWPAGGAR